MWFEIEHYPLREDELYSTDEVKELLYRGRITYRDTTTQAGSWDIAEYMCRLIWTVIDNDAEQNDPQAVYILGNCIEQLHMLIKKRME